MNNSPNDHLLKNRHQQLLSLVAKSFYKELINYGIDSRDVVTISLNLLDQLTSSSKNETEDVPNYTKEFLIDDVIDQWKGKHCLQLDSVCLSPLSPQHVQPIVQWLQSDSIQNTFIDFLPKEMKLLNRYLLHSSDRKYFAVFYQDQFVGVMGAENIDGLHKKLEMKKLIGASEYRGKGIGKRASFLLLYFAFMILNFNKVYIQTMDTNIRNINLNHKLGFELEGIFFQEVQKDEQFFDVVRMSLLKENWVKIYGC